MTAGTELSRRISFTAAAMLAVMMFLLISAGQSKAASEPFHIDFDTSEIQLGTVGDLPIEDLDLSERPRNCLKRAQVNTIGELLTKIVFPRAE